MKLKDYLQDKWILIMAICLFSLYVGVLFGLYNVPFFIIANYYLLLCLLLVGGMGYDYRKRRRFYRHLNQLLEQLDEKYLVSELIPSSNFLEGKLLLNTLRITNKSMKENVNKYAFSMEEYKEYIEMWIHEVKTPLASTRLIIENNPNETLKSIDEELDKLDMYLNQILFYARSSYVEKDFLIKELDIRKIVQLALKKHVKDFSVKKIQLSIEDTVGHIYSDQKWLIFMLDQIINNAVKYVSHQPKIKIYTTEEAQSMTLHIQDNGIGMPSRDLERIFEKGFTGENGRIYEKSTGIGLYLCYKMAQQLGIQIYGRSTVGEGTTISLSFPVSDMYFKEKKT